MSKTRIAVFVSGGGTNLQALIDAAKRGEIPSGEIALVLASNDKAYALTRAAENNIPSIVVKRKEFETQLAYEEAVKAVLAEYIIFRKASRLLSKISGTPWVLIPIHI